MFEQETNADAIGEIDELSEIEYHLTVVEFDILWNRRTTNQEQSRMEELIRLINAFEKSRR
ncbi:hypothetical protein SAMN04515620_11266 [Collimonas sp. OK607]|uniref:hypothetical protein n=1 Tax=Collimonas sp. OK607 TaxID=1798194 RepID=UPI0008F34674|nr:hypothetical protein [Collimonas sp. OK607]SFB01272.1 hypothetical protein SAMN04515620_11266 [Collimonas sp. OK607]